MAELSSWLGQLSSGAVTLAGLANSVSESAEHIADGNVYQVTDNTYNTSGTFTLDHTTDTATVAATIGNLYETALGRAADPSGLAAYSAAILNGTMTEAQIAASLIGSSEFTSKYGGMSTADFVSQMFANSLGRPPTSSEAQYWAGALNSGAVSQADFVAAMAQSPDHLQTGDQQMTSVAISGTGNTIHASGDTLNFAAGASATVDSSGNTIDVTGGDYVLLTGSGYRYVLFGVGNTIVQPRPNNIALSGEVKGSYNFIDLLNLEASYGDLISAFGTNQQAMQGWYNAREPIEQRADTFDGLDYVASYGDLINAFKNAGSEQAVLDAGASHFITNGLNEGRVTTFNSLDYIASYGDLIKAFGANGDAGAYHYIEYGASEGRTTTFDGLDYIASYSDLIKAFGANEQAGAEHFIQNGYNEGRTTTFDGLDYIAGYTDLMMAFGANNDAGATHYIQNGFSEGRNANPFNVAAYESAHTDLIGKYATNDAFLSAYISTYVTTGKFLT